MKQSPGPSDHGKPHAGSEQVVVTRDGARVQWVPNSRKPASAK